MLENTPEGSIFISIIVRGGAAAVSGMQEGDIVENVDEHLITPDMGESQASQQSRQFLTRHSEGVHNSVNANTLLMSLCCGEAL